MGLERLVQDGHHLRQKLLTKEISMKKIIIQYKQFIFIIIIIWMFLGSVIFIFYPGYLASEAFDNLEYKSKVYDIEYRPAHRGHPYVKFDEGWRLLTIEEMKIVPYVQIGDSIVKERGSRDVKVIRNEKDGNVNVVVF